MTALKSLIARVVAVNAKGGFERWCWDVAFQPAQVQDIVQRHDTAPAD